VRDGFSLSVQFSLREVDFGQVVTSSSSRDETLFAGEEK